MIRIICIILAAFGVIKPFWTDAADIPAWSSFSKDDGVYARVSTEDKVIALTFDDGPHPYLTDKILDILDEYNAKATFFVVGQMATAYPEVLKRVALRGHEIGNHTYTHLAESDDGCDKLRSEIQRTEDTVFQLTAKKTFLFRPPTGHCCPSAVKMTGELGYKTVVWDIDTRDWAHNSPARILSEVKKHAHSGSIILFHDFIGRESPTPDALRATLKYLKGQGYSFRTVGEMISAYE